MAERVRVDVEAGVAHVRLNRPDQLNALDPGMFVALCDAAERLAGDPAVRAVVLSGEGTSFCAGLDLAWVGALDGGSAEEVRDGLDPADVERFTAAVADLREREPGRITNLLQRAANCWTELPVPVVAAVHGHAVGAGLQLALAADVRVVAPDARLTFAEVHLGLVPDMTGIPRLAQLVRPDVATLLVCSGRQVDAQEARDIGLATLVEDDPHAGAVRLAGQFAVCSPHAVRAAKRLIAAAGRLPPAEAFWAESDEAARLVGSPNQVEAVHAYLERREPRFTDPEPDDVRPTRPREPAPSRGKHSRSG